MLKTYEQQAQKKLIAIIVGVIGVAAAVVALDHFRARAAALTIGAANPTPNSSTDAAIDEDGSGSTAPTPAPTAPAGSTGTSSGGYKDGTYSATSTYYVPHGREAIKVTLTLKGGVVTSSSVQNSETNDESASYQEEFASAYRSYVVGQKINQLNLDSVAGASDTTQGFNNALSQISQQARA